MKAKHKHTGHETKDESIHIAIILKSMNKSKRIFKRLKIDKNSRGALRLTFIGLIRECHENNGFLILNFPLRCLLSFM